MLEYLVYEAPFAALVVIDELPDNLESVLARKFHFGVEVLQLARYENEHGERLYHFEPFLADLREMSLAEAASEIRPSQVDVAEVDTVVAGTRSPLAPWERGAGGEGVRTMLETLKPKAAPLYAQARNLFSQSGDERNALYARLGWIWAQADTGAAVKFEAEVEGQMGNPLVRGDAKIDAPLSGHQGRNRPREERSVRARHLGENSRCREGAGRQAVGSAGASGAWHHYVHGWRCGEG